MAVFVFSTGSILKTSNTGAQIRVSINNRTVVSQEYRVIVWNTSVSPKVAFFDDTDVVAANQTEDKVIDIPGNANISRFEVEIRALSPHVAPYIQLRYADLFNSSIFEPIYAGELFQDSSATEGL